MQKKIPPIKPNRNSSLEHPINIKKGIEANYTIPKLNIYSNRVIVFALRPHSNTKCFTMRDLKFMNITAAMIKATGINPLISYLPSSICISSFPDTPMIKALARHANTPKI